MRPTTSPQTRLTQSVVQGGMVAWAAADRFAKHSAGITLPHYLMLFPIVFKRKLIAPILAAPEEQLFVDFLRKRPDLMAQTHINLAPYREFTLGSVALAISAGIIERTPGERFDSFRVRHGQATMVDEFIVELTRPEKPTDGPRNTELPRLVKAARRISDWFAQHTLPELCFLLRVRP